MPLDGVRPPPSPAGSDAQPLAGAARLPRDLVRLDSARRQLDRGAAVTVVSGMQGYGKSTLVASWLQDRGDAVLPLWSRVRPGMTAHEVVATLRGAVREVPTRPVVAVVDDAHLLPGDDLLAELDRALARHRDLSVVLVGRGLVVLEPRLTGAFDAVQVPTAELLFGAADVRELATRNGVPLDDADVDRLLTSLGGWPAATAVVVKELAAHPGPLPLSRAVDYLSDVVFPELADGPALHALMRFAIPERLTRNLMRHLLGDAEADRVIAQMLASGLGHRRYLPDDIEYVFPTLVRDQARYRLAARFPDEARAMHRRVAEWHLAHPDERAPLHALTHAAGAEDWDLAAQIWGRAPLPLTAAYPAEVRSLIGVLPAAFRARHPSVALADQVARALLAVPEDGQRTEGNRAYLTPLPGVELDTLDDPDLVQVGSARIAALRLAGDLTGAHQLGERVASRLAGADPSQLGDHLAWLHMQRGFTLLGMYRLTESAETFGLGWRLRDNPTGWVQATITANLALTKAIVGDHADARRWLHRANACSADGFWAGEVCVAIAATVTGLLATDRLEDVYDPAELRWALEIVGQTELWPYAVYVSSMRDLHFRDPERALASLEATVEQKSGLARQTPVARMLVTRVRSDLLLALGDFRRARRVLDLVDPRRSHPALTVARARLALLSGELDHAGELASVVLENRTFTLRTELDLLLLLAEVDLRHGREEDAARLVRRALGVYRATGLLRSFDAVDPDVRPALLTGEYGAEVLSRLQSRVTGRTFPHVRDRVALTPREQVLAGELRRTSSRQEIADTLFVSANTVRSQLRTLYRKLGVGNRAEALDRLAELGF